jgi:hypothetical protein
MLESVFKTHVCLSLDCQSDIALFGFFSYVLFPLIFSAEYVCVVCLMVFNATFNNISAISWRSVLLVKETGVPGENHRPVASH